MRKQRQPQTPGPNCVAVSSGVRMGDMRLSHVRAKPAGLLYGDISPEGLDWQPARPSNPTVPLPDTASIAATWSHTWFDMWVLGSKLKSSCARSTWFCPLSHLLSPESSLNTSFFFTFSREEAWGHPRVPQSRQEQR